MNKISYANRMAVMCIIATEFCERFSFCGLRTILAIYLRNILLMTENESTVVYHVFIMFCYIMPVVGAISADSAIGKYRTIMYFSLVYLAGNLFMVAASVSELEVSQTVLTPVGLLLIAFGTGGVKPCVAAFGGDQYYLPDQLDELQQFFSLFYFSINLGGFMGMIVTPILRKCVTCFGEDTCYPLGFGFPAVLMMISMILFVIGKSWYRMKDPQENVMLNFINCAAYAFRKKLKGKESKPNHWLDLAADKFDQKLIDDMKIVFAVFFLFLPVPLFWSLFDQQGSRWTFQGAHMNGKVFGLEILPDQMQVVNPTMVLVMIPIYDKLIKPLFPYYPFLNNNLNRMAIGGFTASLAFIAAGILETNLEKTYPHLPDTGQASIFVINTLPCELYILNDQQIRIDSGNLTMFKNLPVSGDEKYKLDVEIPKPCGNIPLVESGFFQMYVNLVENRVIAFESPVLRQHLSESVRKGGNDHRGVRRRGSNQSFYNRSNRLWKIPGWKSEGSVSLILPLELCKITEVTNSIALIKTSTTLHHVTVNLKSVDADFQDVYFVPEFEDTQLATSAYLELPDGQYECVIKSNMQILQDKTLIKVEFGGIYALVIREYRGTIQFFKLFAVTPPNSVNILWLLPQYFFISCAEIFFAIAGLEFAFMQGPKSMKTVTIAGWYLCVSVGNFLVILITQANFFKSQAHEFFLFAWLIIIDMLAFLWLAAKYKFVQVEDDSSISLFRGEDYPLMHEEDG